MELEVGCVYEFTVLKGNSIGSKFVAEVIEGLDRDDDYRIEVKKRFTGNYYFAGNRHFISQEMLGDYIIFKPYVAIDYLSVSENIIMNDTLYNVYVNMAIDTDDKEWLIELGNWKKQQNGMNV